MLMFGDFVVANLKISNKKIINRNSTNNGRVEPCNDALISETTIKETFLCGML